MERVWLLLMLTIGKLLQEIACQKPQNIQVSSLFPGDLVSMKIYEYIKIQSYDGVFWDPKDYPEEKGLMLRNMPISRHCPADAAKQLIGYYGLNGYYDVAHFLHVAEGSRVVHTFRGRVQDTKAMSECRNHVGVFVGSYNETVSQVRVYCRTPDSGVLAYQIMSKEEPAGLKLTVLKMPPNLESSQLHHKKAIFANFFYFIAADKPDSLKVFTVVEKGGTTTLDGHLDLVELVSQVEGNHALKGLSYFNAYGEVDRARVTDYISIVFGGKAASATAEEAAELTFECVSLNPHGLDKFKCRLVHTNKDQELTLYNAQLSSRNSNQNDIQAELNLTFAKSSRPNEAFYMKTVGFKYKIFYVNTNTLTDVGDPVLTSSLVLFPELITYRQRLVSPGVSLFSDQEGKERFVHFVLSRRQAEQGNVFVYTDDFKGLVLGQSPKFEGFAVLSRGCFDIFLGSNVQAVSIDTKVFSDASLTIPYYYHNESLALVRSLDTIELKFDLSLPTIKSTLDFERSRLYSGYTKGYHSLLNFDSYLVSGAYDQVALKNADEKTPYTNFAKDSMTPIKYFLKENSFKMRALSPKTIGTKDFAFDLEAQTLFACETDLSDHFIALCTSVKKVQQVRIGRILKVKTQLPYVMLVHSSSRQRVTYTLFSLKEQIELHIDIQTDATQELVEAEYYSGNFYLIYTQGRRAYVHFGPVSDRDKWQTHDFGIDNVVAMNTKCERRPTIGLMSRGFFNQVSLEDFSNRSMLHVNLESTSYLHMCGCFGSFNYVASDGKSLYLIVEDKRKFRLDFSLSQIDGLHCVDKSVFVRSGQMLYQLELNDGSNLLLSTRYSPRNFYSLGPGDLLMHQYMNDTYVVQQAADAIAVYHVNKRGTELYLLDPPATLAMEFSSSNPTVPAYSLTYHMEGVDSHDGDLSIVPKQQQLPENLASFSFALSQLAALNSHVWKIKLLALGSKAWVSPLVSAASRTQTTTLKDSWIADFVCQRDVCAYLIDKAGSDVSLLSIKQSGEELASIEIKTSPSKRGLAHLQIVRQDSTGVTVFVAEDQTGASMFKLYYYQVEFESKKIATQTSILYREFEKITIHVSGKLTFYDFYDQHRNTLYFGETAQYESGRLMLMNDVRIYSIAQLEADFFLLFCKYGMRELMVTRYSTLDHSTHIITTQITDMNMFDSMRCEPKTGKQIECVMAGRYIKTYLLQFTTGDAAKHQLVEQHHAYKNMIVTAIHTSEQFIALEAIRFVSSGKVDDTFDLSGVLLYRRNAQHPYVVAAMSKDDIFDEVKSNTFRLALHNDSILIHGGKLPFILKYGLSDYKIEGRIP